MHDKEQQNIKDLTHECEICHIEIPESTAATREGADYVWHICGSCYQKLKDQSSS